MIFWLVPSANAGSVTRSTAAGFPEFNDRTSSINGSVFIQCNTTAGYLTTTPRFRNIYSSSDMTMFIT
jgi:hypothetical protein